VLGEEAFSSLLVYERKRSERSNRPFVLLSVTSKDGRSLDLIPAGTAALEALSAAIRDTDFVGWLKWPNVIGVLLLEIGAVEPARVIETVRARVHREWSRRPDAGGVGDYSFDFHVYPESSRTDSTSAGPGSVDHTFYPDLLGAQKKPSFYDRIKRAFDAIASLALLLILSPLLLAVAALVRLTSSGPVLFRQLRVGTMGQPFRMLKFRTMYTGVAENTHYEFISRFIKNSRDGRAPSGNQFFKLQNDPRVTPVGRILRKTSIDELPQLWNVLIGEMSLVGPRPPLPYEIKQYSPWHRRRMLEAKPGITGLWQVTGRSRTTFDEMVRLDLRYARTRSLWTDFRILLRTPRAVISGNGAC